MRMTDQERMNLADQWVASEGGADELADLRSRQDAFKETHPAYAGYADFRKPGEGYPGGPLAFRDDLMRNSPSYRKYIGRLKPADRDDPNKILGMDAYLAAHGTKANIYAADLGDPGSWPQTEMLVKLGLGGGKDSGQKYDDTTPAGMAANLSDALAGYQRDAAS